jgi:hypothetical protein
VIYHVHTSSRRLPGIEPGSLPKSLNIILPVRSYKLANKAKSDQSMSKITKDILTTTETASFDIKYLSI